MSARLHKTSEKAATRFQIAQPWPSSQPLGAVLSGLLSMATIHCSWNYPCGRSLYSYQAAKYRKI